MDTEHPDLECTIRKASPPWVPDMTGSNLQCHIIMYNATEFVQGGVQFGLPAYFCSMKKAL